MHMKKLNINLFRDILNIVSHDIAMHKKSVSVSSQFKGLVDTSQVTDLCISLLQGIVGVNSPNHR